MLIAEGLVNPITTMFFVKSYRYALLSALGIRRRVIMPDKTVVTGALSLAPTSGHATCPTSTNIQ